MYEAERHRPGLVTFTDGSRTEEGAVTWKKVRRGSCSRLGFEQEAYGAAIVRAPETAARRRN